MTGARCSACGAPRSFADLLAVWARAGEPAPDVLYVCRPTLEDARRDCLARCAAPAAIDAIAPADAGRPFVPWKVARP